MAIELYSDLTSEVCYLFKSPIPSLSCKENMVGVDSLIVLHWTIAKHIGLYHGKTDILQT